MRKTACLGILLTAVLAVGYSLEPHEVPTPKAWSSQSLVGYRIPLAGLGRPPELISEHDYYALPESNVKTYPVYTPEKEPAGYIDWLKNQDPQPLVEVTKLKTPADWLAAGRGVFYGRELPRYTGSEDNLQLIRNPKVLEAYRLQTTGEGVLLGLRYVVRQKGKVELGTDTCAMCHVQVRHGSIVEGPPNNSTPFGPLMADLTRRYAQVSPAFFEQRRRQQMREDYRVPYLKNDPNLAVADLPPDQIADLYARVPLGAYMRTNTSLLYPVKIANLVGVKDLAYFDRTGTARQRDITDLMRYIASIADVTDALTVYGDGDGDGGRLKPQNLGLTSGVHRTPDPMLYALAMFVYSLAPPKNPNAFDDGARAGQRVFQQNCARCHVPPLYTSNKLTLAKGFEPTDEERKQLNLLDVSVGTDPGLALQTRKGTGFYRVPSLRMLWTNVCFLHDGSIGSLEEMFDPQRLQPTFRSSNWSATTPSRAVAGHPFGLGLSASDRTALIKFLRTL
ncbi:MAG: hypothetical protein M3Y24_07235 [Acidobacteriota bacterium]|nr:hypothetical protein [Acidobacteriota bacterium]